MAGIIEALAQQLGGSNLQNISRAIGADESSTSNAISAALPTLLGALARNASSPEGAQNLGAALNRDHDGSVLDNLAGLLGGGGGGGQASIGDGILRHVLGSRRPRVETGIGQASGLDAGSVGKLLTMLAPMVMGQLGRAQRQQGLDASQLSSLLSNERKQVEKQAPQNMGLLGSLLDADNDGDVDMSDIARQGVGVLGKLFSGR